MPVKKKTKPRTQTDGNFKAKKTSGTSQKSISWFRAVMIAIIVLLAIRTFFLQSFIVQNTAMCGNLFAGDWIVINKAAYGSRMPITMFSIPFAPLRINTSSQRLYSDLAKLPYFRLSGYSNIQNNDIIAFNYPNEENTPVDKKIVYAKRCVAIPGDTMKMFNSQLIINNKTVTIDNLFFLYKVKVKGKSLKQSTIDKYNLNEGGAINNFGEYNIYISTKQAEELKNEPGIELVVRDRKLQNYDKDYVYPHDVNLNWTLDNYGPIVIPKAGEGIAITKNNLSIYRDILEKYEKCTVTIEDDKVLINNKLLNSYFFKYNYYFVLDDNRDNSKDSRLWGFLPETHLIGRVAFIASSFDPVKKGFNKIRWSRTLKRIK